MRFLLMSDTHGRLGLINELANRSRADAVIHAGDFGFYADDSYDRLSPRELRLLIVHADMEQEDKDQILALPRAAQGAAARDCRLAGELQSFIDGTASFAVPVYAVWGNHEDRHIVERLYDGRMSIPNLHLLHDRRYYKAGPAFVFGLGGNLSPGPRMLQQAIAGGSGKIWSTLSQYARMVQMVEAEHESTGPRIFVSHVSPGKESFIEWLAVRLRADLTVSGHMGAPHCMIWNPFSIFTADDWLTRLQDGFDAVAMACWDTGTQDTDDLNKCLALIKGSLMPAANSEQPVKAPPCYRSMTHINLPDAHMGYAILDIAADGNVIQTGRTAP